VFGFPPCLQGHAGAREPVLERHCFRENALDIGDLRQTVAASRIQRKAIEVEADDGIAIPFPPRSERLVEEITFDREEREVGCGRDHFHVTAQSSYSIGERANPDVASAALLNILRDGGYKGDAQFTRLSSATPSWVPDVGLNSTISYI